jgi:glycosyltransferase involved in cell wall biosynthesis
MRLAVYTDYAYHRVGDQVYAERAFALFLASLAKKLDRMVVAGRLNPDPSKARYSLGDVDFVALPFYRSLAEPLRALPAMARSLRRLWRALDDVDAVWVIGPHLLVFPIAAIAALRRRSLVLGVRQEYVEYVRNRHPRRRMWHLFARLLEGSFRMLARVCPVIVVGPRLAEIYGRSPRLLEISVSLIEADQIVPVEKALEKDYEDGALRLLSVGRLDPEKDPLLLADVLAKADPRWRLIVCGEGSLESALRERLGELGVTDRAELVGYVPHDAGLADLYGSCHALVHISRTEGVPQVLFEAFAGGLPVVATDVGGIRGAVGDAALLFPAGDADEAAALLDGLVRDEGLRRGLVERGHTVAEAHTLDAETARVGRFILAQEDEPSRIPKASS